MAKKIIINNKNVTKDNINEALNVCPFGGLEIKDGKLEFTAGCKSCGLCAKKFPNIFSAEELKVEKIDKSLWNGVCVFIETDHEGIHPVSIELIGKARELASVINHKVYAILVCDSKRTKEFTDEILSYGVDEVAVYNHELLDEFNLERYARCVMDFISIYKPNTVLYGGTALGRSLAPRVAAHFRNGLTADCTSLGMKENTDLIQVRPAFGGNVMAQIVSPNHRPQMATVRYKIFKKPEKEAPHGIVKMMDTSKINFESGIKTLKVEHKAKITDISNADIIVACGRAFKSVEDLELAERLASLLGGTVAVTRPLVEAGFRDAKFQIGLSGRTVAPKLIITLGISGAVQFTAGMKGSETIISINKDPQASIFDVSHYAVVGDVFKIVPLMIEHIEELKGLVKEDR